jgi:hypothetical protein
MRADKAVELVGARKKTSWDGTHRTAMNSEAACDATSGGNRAFSFTKPLYSVLEKKSFRVVFSNISKIDVLGDRAALHLPRLKPLP